MINRHIINELLFLFNYFVLFFKYFFNLDFFILRLHLLHDLCCSCLFFWSSGWLGDKDFWNKIGLFLYRLVLVWLHYEIFLFDELRSRTIFEIGIICSGHRIRPLKFWGCVWAWILKFGRVAVRSKVGGSHYFAWLLLVRLWARWADFLRTVTDLIRFYDFWGGGCVVEWRCLFL